MFHVEHLRYLNYMTTIPRTLRNQMKWIPFIVPVVAFVWIGVSFLVRLPIDPSKVHPEIVGFHQPVEVFSFYDSSGANWSIKSNNSAILVSTRKESDGGIYLLISENGFNQRIEERSFPHSRRFIERLIEESTHYIVRSNIRSLYSLSNDPLSRTRWTIKLWFAEVEDWFRKHGIWLVDPFEPIPTIP